MKTTKKFHKHLISFNTVSKKSILIIAIIAFSILNINASNKFKNLNAFKETTTFSENNIAQVFNWKVETNKSIYSGTSLSFENAEAMIALSSSGEIILGSEIQSSFVLKSETSSNRNYFWEVETETGSAKGFASSEDYANKMIALVASGDTIIAKIIISQPQH
ncbi:hypothetical protein [Mariniflexile sp.]|uniref:hypothetical protein n=1 Tax=Mariniflexile sp. TaxID=1979402 RepID=UPI00356B03E1